MPNDDYLGWASANRRQARIEVDRELVRVGGLSMFIKLAWPTVEGGTIYRSNWHIEAICEHLEAISKGEIKRLIIAVPPRHMKPCYELEPVILQDRGRVPLKDVVVGDMILTHRGRFRRVEAVHDNGVLPTVRLNTWQQRSARMAPDHPVLTPAGWKACGELTSADVVGAVPPAEELGQRTVTPEEARLLAYIVGDGSVAHGYTSVASADPDTIADIRHCVASLGWKSTEVLPPGKRATSIGITHHKRPARGDNSIHEWRDRHGLHFKNSYTKRVPAAIMAGDLEVVRNFVAAYWACDGQFTNKSRTVTSDGYGRLHLEAVATTVSRELASDIQHLLLRLGIEARVRRRDRPNRTRRQFGDRYVYYNVTITDLPNVAKFARTVPMVHPKFHRVALLAKLPLADFDRPIWRDAVVSVTSDEPGRCICLTVEEDHSFTVGDIAVHNSVSVAVMWPAYDWLDRPSRRTMFASYAESLSIRDSARCRRVIQSPWYQDRWGDRFRITSDQNTKKRFENDKTGYRLATSVGGTLTGEGADFVMVDDPLNSSDSDSVAKREGMLTWWNESMSTRLNDPAKGAFVIIQQRLHTRDLIGDILEKHGVIEDGGEYVYLCLPAENDPEHPNRWFRDPRTKAGELLWPAHVPQATVESLKRALGPYAAAGQLQQLPAPREGGIFKRSWFPRVKVLPPDLEYSRGWDLAASEAKVVKSDPDYTATAKIGWSRSAKRWYLVHVERWRENPSEIERLIKHVSDEDAVNDDWVKIGLPQDPGQAGKGQASALVRLLAGYDVKAEPQSGDKVTRAMPFASQASGGNISILEAPWNDEFLTELTSFPNAPHDDMVDAVATAFTRMTGGSSGLMEFYMRQLDDDAKQQIEAAERLAANGGVLPGLIVHEETTEDLGRAFIAGQRPTT